MLLKQVDVTAATLGNLFLTDAVHHFQIKPHPHGQSAASMPALTITVE
jgi:hypothetical protein